jgi:ATP-dependent protease HslVU (ClpYQ) peptidase subunit
LAEVCSPHTPVASTKLAVRKNGKLIMAAAGTNSSAPTTITNNEMTMVRL